MKVVKFKGGLGNQLFQYTFLRNLELKFNIKEVKADFFYYSSLVNDVVRKPRIEKLNIRVEKATQNDIKKLCIFKRRGNPLKLLYKGILYLEKTLNRKYYLESDRSYTNIDEIKDYNYFDGYWQSWRYVNEIKAELKEELTPNFKLSKKTNEIINQISEQNAIFIGIRRGDYLDSKTIKHYGSFDEKYYRKAINIIKLKVDNPVFYLFSNDIQWVRKNINFGVDIIFRDKESQTSDLEELFIMAQCKHAIIVNSSYYWWGAWLIENTDKIIISPKKWFADDKPIDIIPETWIRI